MPECREVERVFVMDYLHLSYNPENDMECIKLFNVLDALLEEKSGPVVLSAAKLFYAFIKKLETNSSGILGDFMLKLSPQIIRFLKSHTNQEFQFSVMTFISDLCDEGFSKLFPLKNHLHFKQKDHDNCRKIKVQLLFRFCEMNIIDGLEKTSENDDILDYLLSQFSYQPSIDKELVSNTCQMASLCQEIIEKEKSRYGL